MRFARWEVVLLVVAAVVFFVWTRVAAAPSIHDYARVHGGRMIWAPLARVFAEAGNGDILLFASPRNKVVRYFTGSPFTHVAMVVRDRPPGGSGGADVAYVWDVDLGQGCRSGARVVTLSDKLSRMAVGAGGVGIAGWKRLTSPRPSTPRLLAVIAKYLSRGMDRLFLRWVACRLFGAAVGGGSGGHMFCSEAIARTSQDLGLFHASTPAARYAPCDWHKNDLDLAPGAAYGPTEFFRFEPKSFPG
uniref:Permuted papain-like amidase n=1 Tax=Marseillevirus LCMAC103 TaxID=2506604 RepID=A0A481YV83_9VIRU|nr:MAG: permuted papain-like amidase [Marseillevirus LCMAC103]